MAKIISAHFEDNPLKAFSRKLLALDFFTKATIVFVILVAIVTPGLISNHQLITSSASSLPISETDWSSNNFWSQNGIDVTSSSGQISLQKDISDPSTFVINGNLISKSIRVTLKNVMIAWDSLAPAGTLLKFQIRSANRGNKLSARTFLGPDGTQETYYEISGTTINTVHNGDSWLQYKVYLETADPKLTPYLYSITFDNVALINTKSTPASISPPASVSASQVKLGDVKVDGKIDVFDAMFIAQYVDGSRKLTAEQLLAADVSNDNKVTLYDSRIIANYVVGMINSFDGIPILGDVKVDGKIDVFDAMFIAQYVDGSRKLTAEQLLAADVSGDTKVTLDDSNKIANYVAHNISSLE